MQIIFWEFGDSGNSPSRTTESFIRSKDTHAYDAVVFVFDATERNSYADLWERWVKLRGVLSAKSGRVPFVVFAETHCDQIGPAKRIRHRRAVEIDLYLNFGASFIYTQLDASDTTQREKLWTQVAVQMRCQPPRNRPKIRVTIIDEEKSFYERFVKNFWKTWRSMGRRCCPRNRIYFASDEYDSDDDMGSQTLDEDDFWGVEIY